MECPAMRKLKHGSVHPKGSRGRAESPLVAAAAAILPAPIKVKKQECALRRGGGRAQSPPPRSRRSEIPAFRKRAAMSERPATRSRPFGATMCRRLVERLGGASADARSYWQGRFAACAFVGGFLGIGRPKNSWGVAPNPARDAVPCPCKGQTKRDEVPP